ncbi:MAG: hypothetical protein RL015_3870 [Verrucomicrobiota bacterium]
MNLPTEFNQLWTRRFVWLLAAVLIFRAVFMLFFCAHVDLAGDEAYYWDWGRVPDWGYYSKPPMIGWLMGTVGWLTGDSEWGIRALALLLGTGTLVLIFALARQLYSAKAAFMAVVLVLLTPASAGLNLFLTIDAPLLLTWSAALALFWAAVEKPHCWVRWLLLTLVIGLGTLSKQMMLVFPLLMVVFAFVSKADRVLLKNPRFWLSMIVGAAFLLPVLWWNEQHAWITLEHTKHHFDTKSVGFGKWLTRTLEWPGVQALVYTPVTWAALIYILLAGFRYWPQMARRERFLILFSGPALIVFSLLALRQRINPNWPAVFYVPAFILVGAWFTAHLPVQGFVTWKRWTLRVAGTVTLLLHLALPVVFLTSLKGHPKLNALRGWEQVGQQMGQYLNEVPRPQQTQVLALGHRYHAAQLAFYMPQHPRLFRFEPLGHAMSQYEVWPGLEQHLGDDVLIMTDKPVPKAVSDCFERVEPFGKITLADGDAGRVFEVFLGQKLNTWKKVGVR